MGKFNLKSVAVGMLVLLLVQVLVCWAGYTIDADLSDWGVTPFTDWIPAGNADYEQTDNVNRYGASGYSEPYDWEALYFDDDGLNFYFAGVSSYRVGHHSSSDLGIDLNGDATISTHGIVSGLEYAIQMDDNFGEISVNPNWSNTTYHEWAGEGWQGSPRNATGGTVLGSATVVIKQYPSMEYGTYIFEAAVPRRLFNVQQAPGQPVSAHMATWCGNDSINLTGDINTPYQSPKIDIRCDRSDAVLRVLADDFERSKPGIVTKVILWGSWKDDIKGQIKKIHLSFHNDIPADACDPCSYSMPGNELWSRDFNTGEFTESLYATFSLPDWFWDPAGGQAADPCNDYQIWQYEIPIKTWLAFAHGGSPHNPAIYWLDVYVELEPDSNNPQFGWKTTTEHWNDDAVWSNDAGSTWNELRYPPQHSYCPNSIDLAFAIESEKGPVPHLKWSQPPIEIDPNVENPAVYCGWDEPSWRFYTYSESIWFSAWDCPYQCHGDADCKKIGPFRVNATDLVILRDAWGTAYPAPNYDPRADFNRDLEVSYEDADIITMWFNRLDVPADCPSGALNEFWKAVADDFRCLGTMPITSIHWWGSYYGWEGPEAPVFAPIGWRIGFWSNVAEDPCDPNTFSYPKELLWQMEVDVNRVDETVVGRDSFPQHPSDTCFQYYVELEPNEIFRQDDYNNLTEDNIYWISIAAIYHKGIANVEYPWGWKTRSQHWMDDAVTFEMNEPPQIGMILDPCDSNMTPIKDDAFGVMESYDMAFELDTDPNYIKWEQACNGIRYWMHYEDELSMAKPEPNIIRLVADDWRCERRTPVTAIVWWGSYIDYAYEACKSQAMSPPVKPDYFQLSIWTDVPKDACEPDSFSHPCDVIWEYKAYDYDEVLVGYDKRPHGEPNEPVFRYSVRLPEEKWFKQPDVNGIFWLSVVAVYDTNVPNPNYDWGWTNHAHVFNDNAVSGYYDDVNEVYVWSELFDQTEQGEDMSFVLFTDPNECVNCANYNLDSIVNFIDYAYFADDWRWTGPAGGYNNSDLNCDGHVDLYDLDIFVEQWLDSCP